MTWKVFLSALAIMLTLNISAQEIAGFKVDLDQAKETTGYFCTSYPIYSEGRYTYYLLKEQKDKTVRAFITKRDDGLNDVVKTPFYVDKLRDDLDNRFWDTRGAVEVVNASISDDGATLNIFMLLTLDGALNAGAYSDENYSSSNNAALYLLKYDTKDLKQKSTYLLAELKAHNQVYQTGLSSTTKVNTEEGWVAIASVDQTENVVYKRFNDNGEVVGEKGFKTPDGLPMLIEEISHTSNGYVYMLTKVRKYGSVVFSFNPFDNSDIKVTDLGMKEGTTYSKPYFITSGEDKVYIVGTYADRDLEKPKGYYVRALSPKAAKEPMVHLPFDKAMLSFLMTGKYGNKVKNGEPYRLSITDVRESEGKLFIVSSVQWIASNSQGVMFNHQYETTVSVIDLNASTLTMKSGGFFQHFNTMESNATYKFMWIENGTLYIVRTDHMENVNNPDSKKLKRIKYKQDKGIGLVLTSVTVDGKVKSYMIPDTESQNYSILNFKNIPGSRDAKLVLYGSRVLRFSK